VAVESIRRRILKGNNQSPGPDRNSRGRGVDPSQEAENQKNPSATFGRRVFLAGVSICLRILKVNLFVDCSPPF
jgi:hypothetical protein